MWFWSITITQANIPGALTKVRPLKKQTEEEMSLIQHLSYSSIRQYMECGLQFKFRKIDNLKPEHTPEALIFGSCIHKALSRYNQHKANHKTVNLPELKDWFEKYWISAAENTENLVYTKDNDFYGCLNKGKELLETFYANRPVDSEYEVIEVERDFVLELEDIPYEIIGYIDLIERDEENNIIITEYKTATKSYSKQQIDLNDQITLYHLYARRRFPAQSIMSKIDCLLKKKRPAFEQYYTYRSREDHSRFINVTAQVAKAIEAGIFIPNTYSWRCTSCEYQNACKAWLSN